MLNIMMAINSIQISGLVNWLKMILTRDAVLVFFNSFNP